MSAAGTAKKNAAKRRRVYEAARGEDGVVRCWWCRDPLSFGAMTLEHLKPRHAGGTNRDSNLRPACFTCNNNRGRGLGFPVEAK